MCGDLDLDSSFSARTCHFSTFVVDAAAANLGSADADADADAEVDLYL